MSRVHCPTCGSPCFIVHDETDGTSNYEPITRATIVQLQMEIRALTLRVRTLSAEARVAREENLMLRDKLPPLEVIGSNTT